MLNIDPATLQKLLQALQGGGGMPPGAMPNSATMPPAAPTPPGLPGSTPQGLVPPGPQLGGVHPGMTAGGGLPMPPGGGPGGPGGGPGGMPGMPGGMPGMPPGQGQVDPRQFMMPGPGMMPGTRFV